MSTFEDTVDAVVARVWSLDLDTLRAKFRDGLAEKSHDDADLLAERSYREFLVLAALYPNVHLVPTLDMDEFWHLHILDTRKYQRDCEYALGFFLHHVPSSAVPEETAKEEKLETMFALIRRHFPDSPTLRKADCGKCSRCSSPCRSYRSAVEQGSANYNNPSM